MPKFIFILSFCLLCSTVKISAQKYDVSCSSVKYESHNQVDPNPLIIRKISGKVLDNPQKGEGQPISSVCIALFEEKTKKLIKIVSANDKGDFNLKGIADGDYRLVVKSMYGFYCTANIPLKINSKTPENRKVAVYLLAGAIDQCSYGDLM